MRKELNELTIVRSGIFSAVIPLEVIKRESFWFVGAVSLPQTAVLFVWPLPTETITGSTVSFYCSVS